MAQRVAVIGGGIAGLAAAHRLVELGGCDVALFEVSARLGGAICTKRQDGYLVEYGADNFITTNPAGLDLCRRIGFEGELIRTRQGFRSAYVVHRGRLERVPEGFLLMQPRRLWPMVTTGLLSPVGKLRLLCEALVPRRRDGADESLASFARRRLGHEAYERLVEPLVGGIYTADGEQLSLAATLPRFVEMERRHGGLIRAAWRGAARDASQDSAARYSLFVAPRNGMQSLVEALAARLPEGAVRLGAAVEQIGPDPGGGWSIQCAGLAGAEGRFDAVVLALPAFRTAAVLAAVDPQLAAELAAIPYASSAVAILGYRAEQLRPLDAFGVVVPAIEGRSVLAISAASVKYAGRAPEGRVLLRVFLGGARRPELAELPDEDLQRMAQAEVAELLNAQGEPELTRIVRWPRAMPQYHVGHLERVTRIEGLAARHSGLALAGSAYRGVGVPDCVAGGERAAEQVHSSACQ
jgi:oxygen-dependent protoporphyrinogen oxidase